MVVCLALPKVFSEAKGVEFILRGLTMESNFNDTFHAKT